MDDFLRAEEQVERRRVREGPKGVGAGSRCRGVRAIRAGAENFGRSEAGLRGSAFAGDVRATFRRG